MVGLLEVAGSTSKEGNQINNHEIATAKELAHANGTNWLRGKF